jgi:hypothetical protein
MRCTLRNNYLFAKKSQLHKAATNDLYVEFESLSRGSEPHFDSHISEDTLFEFLKEEKI